MSDDEAPMPTLEAEVAANVYDWDDPARNEYDYSDGFVATDNEPLGGDDDGSGRGDDIVLFSPQTLARLEAQGRPSRNRRKPQRYTPPSSPAENGRYTYDNLGDDDDGASVVTVNGEDGDEEEEVVGDSDSDSESSSSSAEEDIEEGAGDENAVPQVQKREPEPAAAGQSAATEETEAVVPDASDSQSQAKKQKTQ